MEVIKSQSSWSPAYTLSGAGALAQAINRAGGTGLLSFSSSGLSVTLQARHLGSGNYVSWPCRDAADGTYYPAGSTITSTAQKVVQFDARNVSDIQVTTVSGTGSFYIGVNPLDPPTVLAESLGTVQSLTPTISASPDYSAGDCVGGILSFTVLNAGLGRPVKVKSLVVKDKNGQSPALSFLFFKSTPTGGTYTDNSALAFGSGDVANLTGVVRIVAGDYYVPVTGTSVAALGGIDQIMAVGAQTLFCLMVADSSLNAASTSDITLELGVEQV